ncbi:MAG: holo-ACP synthase, partial [Deltaproteobacteria bacterium]|nr:holo-ACP synthase [Deltaproteobacteria bacterium]
MIHGIGIDIVHIPRFKKALERWGDNLKRRVFTSEELDYCSAKGFPEQHLAVRFAAKEAFFKAIGKGLRFRDLEVLHDGKGRPVIKVRGGAMVFYNELGIGVTHLTLS